MCSISSEPASISIVILCIKILTRMLEKNDNNIGICTMKGESIKSLKSHFAGIEERKELCLATLLDPRFKDNFSGNIIRATVREMLVDEMTRLTSSPVTISENAVEEPGPSHPKRTCPLESTVLLDVISEMITDSNGDSPITTIGLETF